MPSHSIADVVRDVAAPAVVLDPSGRVVASNAAWLASTPEAVREQVAVGEGADYLGVVRRSAERGDGDAAAVRDLIEGVVAGHEAGGSVDYPCPTPAAHRWFRLTAIRLRDRYVLLVHMPTVRPRPGGDEAVTVPDDVAHDLTRPLDTARGLVETVVARGDAIDPAGRDEALRAAHRQLDHALQLLAELRAPGPTLSEAGPDPVRLDEVLAEAGATTGVAWRQDGDPDCRVSCDRGQLERVLVNLFDNVVKYGQAPVQVTVRRVGPRVELQLHDHGHGLPPDMLDGLFPPRRRGRRHRDGDLPGSGLGLSIVRDLLRVNGGTIVHRPDLPGAGFWIDLPAADPAAP